MTYASSQIAHLLAYLENPLPALNANVVAARCIEDLPNITWEEVQIPLQGGPVNGFRSSQATRDFWTPAVPTPDQRDLFRKIIASRDSKKGVNNQCDISHGEKSSDQTVRFPDAFDPEEDETLHYINTAVPTSEEQFASALRLGYEHQYDRSSRFCTGTRA